MSQGLRVLLHHRLSLRARHNEVAGIEHIQHIHRNSVHPAQMIIDNILVTTQLHRTVAPYRLMEIGSLRIIERAGSKIEDPVIRIRVRLQFRILQNRPVYGIRHHGTHGTLGRKVLLAYILAVYMPHIHHNQNGKDGNRRHRLELILHIQPKRSRSQQDKDQGTPCARHQQTSPVRLQSILQDLRILGIARRLETEHGLAEQSENQAETAGNAHGSQHVFLITQHFLPGCRKQSLQGQYRQHRHRKFGNNQCHRWRPETIVQRQVIEKEIVEPSQMPPPG